MRASTDQLRDLTLEAVDVAQHHVSELVNSGAERLSASVSQGAASLGDSIGRVTDAAPTVSLEVAPHRRHHLTRGVVIALLAALVGLVVFRWVKAQRTSGSEAVADADQSPDDT